MDRTLKMNTQNIPNPTIENVERHLTTIETDSGYPIYNLMGKIKVPTNINPVFYDLYQPVTNESFQTISYKHYGTISLWWLICLVNNLYNITEGAVAGIPLKIIKKQYIGDMLEEI